MSDFIASQKILETFSSELRSVIGDNCYRHSTSEKQIIPHILVFAHLARFIFEICCRV